MSSTVLKTFRDSDGHDAVIQWEKGCVKYHAIACGYGRFESWYKTISGAKQALKRLGYVEIKEQGEK